MIPAIGPFSIVERTLKGFKDRNGVQHRGAVSLRLAAVGSPNYGRLDLQGLFQNCRGEWYWTTLVSFPKI